jgi:hypothetical protein
MTNSVIGVNEMQWFASPVLPEMHLRDGNMDHGFQSKADNAMVIPRRVVALCAEGSAVRQVRRAKWRTANQQQIPRFALNDSTFL